MDASVWDGIEDGWIEWNWMEIPRHRKAHHISTDQTIRRPKPGMPKVKFE